MSPLFNLVLQAKADLQSIWNYSFETWGEAQADKYITALYNRFEWLADNPRLGKHRPDIKENYYCYLEGSHLIFYIQNDSQIDVIGVPHKAMDILNYFDA